MKPLFDIFSKPSSEKTFNKKISQKPKIKIIADYREKNSLIISELMKLGLEVETRELKVADYIVRDTAIERKTVSDFISSMINKRLFNQIEELKQYKSRLLLIEGVSENELYDDSSSGVNSNAIRGFILSIVLKHNIPIIFAKNFQDSAKFISVLAKKQTSEASLNAKKKTLSQKEQLQYIIEGFPGIGPKNAKKLLEKYKTIQNIINASEEELRKDIGKKADSIINLRRVSY